VTWRATPPETLEGIPWEADVEDHPHVDHGQLAGDPTLREILARL
jgi:hypothetical protein